jgi:hypothetical protein
VELATAYYLWVNDSAGTRVQQWYTPAAANCPNGTGYCSVTPNTALDPGMGEWWIQTWNPTGYGPWSKGQSFTLSP